MKKTFLFLVAVLVLSVSNLQAQYDGAKDAISFRGIFPNYSLPLDSDFETDDFGGGLEIEYARHLGGLLNLAVPFKFASAKYALDDNADLLDKNPYIGLDALLQLRSFSGHQFFNPALYAGLGVNAREFFDDFDVTVPIGVQLDMRLGNNVYFSPKIEYRVGFDDLDDNVQIGGGFKVLLGGEDTSKPMTPEVMDRDGDGVEDAQDLCPDEAGLAALNGCPDSDGDGVPNGSDDCPDVPGLKNLNGCPDADNDGITDAEDECPTEAGTAANNGCPVRDADGDGVPDDQDECPNEFGTAANNGCPVRDADGDGVPDAEDRCPNVAGSRATNGCPDTDGDGVVDADDRCPTTPGLATNNGCPELKAEEKETLDLAMSAVQFETGSATLKTESLAILNEIAQILSRYPDYKMSINGHTDSIGSSATNQSLSERRAKSCYEYLISQGISASRMNYAGYGESRPIADNRYKDGREKNRRVEFDLYLGN